MINVSVLLMALLYIAAGVTHFLKPRMYIRIMPPFIPRPGFWVALTGAWELAAGILLLFPDTRAYAAWSLVILLILVFPANVQMMLNFRRRKHRYTWITILRLPLQILLIWWAWSHT